MPSSGVARGLQLPAPSVHGTHLLAGIRGGQQTLQIKKSKEGFGLVWLNPLLAQILTGK